MDCWSLFVILLPVIGDWNKQAFFLAVHVPVHAMGGWIRGRRSVDWKGAGWYRITGGAGTKLADFDVAEKHCGTYASGWMSGGHPTVFQGEVTRIVNFYLHGERTWKTSSIKVINCNTHYVYYLEEVPHCPLRYCTA